jgi:hypothetical protein
MILNIGIENKNEKQKNAPLSSKWRGTTIAACVCVCCERTTGCRQEIAGKRWQTADRRE